MAKIKIMTYNIRHGRGTDLRYSLERIADVIRESDADIVGLNEVYQVPRFLEQTKTLAEMLGMNYIFQRNVSYGPHIHYGNAILTKGNILETTNLKLPRHLGIERRGMLISKVEIGQTIINFGVSHLSLGSYNRIHQIRHITEELQSYSPLVFAGDFNAKPNEMSPISGVYQSVGEFDTYPANRPNRQLDYMFYDKKLKLTRATTIGTQASDHLPLLATFEIQKRIIFANKSVDLTLLR